MKKKLLGYYDYTVVLTYCGMLFAFCGILMSIGEHYLDAIICLLLAGVCDMFDGAVAATKERDERAKRFGIQIDSLSDLISFGVLPALFVYMLSGKDVVTGVIARFRKFSTLTAKEYCAKAIVFIRAFTNQRSILVRKIEDKFPNVNKNPDLTFSIQLLRENTVPFCIACFFRK